MTRKEVSGRPRQSLVMKLNSRCSILAVRALLAGEGRMPGDTAELSAAGRQMVDSALVTIDSLTELIEPLRAQLQAIGRREPGARALMNHYGIAALCAAIIRAEGKPPALPVASNWCLAATTPCAPAVTKPGYPSDPIAHGESAPLLLSCARLPHRTFARPPWRCLKS